MTVTISVLIVNFDTATVTCVFFYIQSSTNILVGSRDGGSNNSVSVNDE